MQLVSYSWRGMLTQGPTPDPKRKLNISSSYHYHIHQIASLVPMILRSLCSYYKRWEDGKVGGRGTILCWFWVDDRGGYHIFSIFCSAFVLLLLVLSWLIHDSSCIGFIRHFMLSLSLACSFNQTLLVHRKCVCFVKLFQKSGFGSLVCGFS